MKCLLSATLGLSAFAYLVGGDGVWHMVDVPSVVCPEHPLTSNVLIDTQALNQSKGKQPFIFTIYRTSSKEVSIEFSAKDKNGATIVPKNVVNLPSISGRRLGAKNTADFSDTSERLLRAGGRSFGGSSRGGHSSSRPHSKTSIRRRTPSASSARRRAGAKSADGRKYQGYHGHNVGYSNTQAMNNHFPGGHRPTAYGYTGANAYQSSSNTKVMMAAGAGVAAGALGMYAFSRWNTYGDSNSASDVCYVGPTRYSCQDCYKAYPNQRYKCECRECHPNENAARDDLMQTSFYLKDYVGPVSFVVSSVIGSDFAKNRICPPPGWTRGNMTWNQGMLPGNQDLFIMLSQVDEIENNSNLHKALWPAVQIFFAFLLCSCCFAGICFWMHTKDSEEKQQYEIAGKNQTEYGSKVAVEPENFPIMGSTPQIIGHSQLRWMDTTAPKGMSWNDYCSHQDVIIGEDTGYVEGTWGECLAWAKAYELENPDWANDPKYAVDGPCGQVLAEIAAIAGDEAEEAATRLEQACEHAGERGKPMPLIGHTINAQNQSEWFGSGRW